MSRASWSDAAGATRDGRRHGPPRLLVSVIDAREAAVALGAGADILDVKDPREGSLGAAQPALLREVVRLRDARPGGGAAGTPSIETRPASRVPVSAALGDAPDLPGTMALAAAGAAACGVDILKVGLWGSRTEEGAVALLRRVVGAAREIAPAVRVVAAGYADAGGEGGLPSSLLPRAAARAEADGCMLDTFRKDGRTLLDCVGPQDLAAFLLEARSFGLACGLAGSLTRAQLPVLIELHPDLIGVRGALCRAGRDGCLDPDRLAAFRTALRAAAR